MGPGAGTLLQRCLSLEEALLGWSTKTQVPRLEAGCAFILLLEDGVGRRSAVLGALLSGGEDASWVEGQGDWVTCGGDSTSMSSPRGLYPAASSQVI